MAEKAMSNIDWKPVLLVGGGCLLADLLLGTFLTGPKLAEHKAKKEAEKDE